MISIFNFEAPKRRTIRTSCRSRVIGETFYIFVVAVLMVKVGNDLPENSKSRRVGEWKEIKLNSWNRLKILFTFMSMMTKKLLNPHDKVDSHLLSRIAYTCGKQCHYKVWIWWAFLSGAWDVKLNWICLKSKIVKYIFH